MTEFGQVNLWLDSVSFAGRIIIIVDQRFREALQEQCSEWVASSKVESPPSIDVIEMRTGTTFEAERDQVVSSIEDGWVFLLSIDEFVSIALRDELRHSLASSDENSLYRVSIRHYVFGRWLEHGGYRQSEVRLFPAGSRAALGDRPVTTAGDPSSVRELAAPVVHFSYPKIEHFLTQLNQQTSEGASLLNRVDDDRAQKRRALTPRPLAWLWASFRVFWHRYVRSGGFRDGVAGFIVAVLHSFQFFVEQAKAWEEREGLAT